MGRIKMIGGKNIVFRMRNNWNEAFILCFLKLKRSDSILIVVNYKVYALIVFTLEKRKTKKKPNIWMVIKWDMEGATSEWMND